MKTRFILGFAFLFTIKTGSAQPNNLRLIDSLLFQGDFSNVVNSCIENLKSDSLNPELFYKLGVAYQNLMVFDKSLIAYSQASRLAPENTKYNFALAKYYYTSGRTKLAEPLFTKLYTQDTLNWIYGYYLTDLYMQKGLFNNALNIYSRFYKNDTTNLSFLDKIGFCFLRMGKLDTARSVFEKSLSIQNKNIPALKNLSYIYSRKNMIDTAIYQLNKGLEYDSTDIDLYYRRADIYYQQNYHFRARPDYLRVLASGDSSKLVLKRLGIGLAYNDQPTDALPYLLEAFKKDSNDFEISSYLGKTYYRLKSYKKSLRYYNKVLKLIDPISKQIDYTNVLIADVYKDSSLYDQAIKYYTKSMNSAYSGRICMTIANIYDEKLKNFDKAIQYYQLFLNNPDKNEFYLPDYVKNVKNRLNWIIDNKNKKTTKNGKGT